MIGTYYRLSLADEDVGADKAESNSIQGQRGLVEGYIMARPELATEPRQEYVDDGYSGTSTSRPAFQRLIQDAQDGKVKTIIVKDFSRFARDYIEAGDYMERIFPLLGVRFISVNDGYDSGMQAGNDVRGLEVAIKNIINASYSRDLSAKIAAADHVMQKKGMYLGGYRPFGFLSDPNDCHKLILDPVASRYVRLIFELALQGNRTGTIAKILNENQIPTPAAYHVAENHVYSEQKAWDLQRSHWTSGTVYHILKNEKYKGTYVGAKFIMPVPCKHRVLRAPLEQQVRIEDSHAAIVTPEEFEQAQKVIMLQHTIKPRLERCGADCRKIAFINEEFYNGLTLDDERIRQAIIEFRPRLVVIDPIQAYLGSDSDLQIAGRARKLMRRLGMWAAGYDCAIVLIGHLNKKEGSKGLYRSLGSIDVVAAARSVLQVERDTENPDIRIVHQIKNSLAPTAEDIRFSISADKGFRWLECRPQLFEKQQPDAEPKFDTEQQKAAYWIKHFLEKGDMSANEIYCRLDNEGVSKRVARMVKTEMGIHCYQKKRKWYWSVQPEEGAMNGSQV